MRKAQLKCGGNDNCQRSYSDPVRSSLPFSTFCCRDSISWAEVAGRTLCSHKLVPAIQLAKTPANNGTIYIIAEYSFFWKNWRVTWTVEVFPGFQNVSTTPCYATWSQKIALPVVLGDLGIQLHSEVAKSQCVLQISKRSLYVFLCPLSCCLLFRLVLSKQLVRSCVHVSWRAQGKNNM